MIEKESKNTLIAGGFSDGETILIPNSKKTAEIFMILFHELGHNIDKQFDIKKILKPVSQIKTKTIDLSESEASWLLKESQSGWQSTGITEQHTSIIQKLLKVILAYEAEVKSDIRSIAPEEFNDFVSTATILGSEHNEENGELKIVDKKVHRNSEVPADFVMELLFDVLNRSINRHFSLPDSTRIFKVSPDERNIKSTDIARYLIRKNWNAPAFYSQLPQREE